MIPNFHYDVWQDSADGEFAVVKTSIARYLQHSNTDAIDYIEIKDSASVVKYGRQFLSQPSEKSTMKVRYFDDIEQDIFLER